MAKWIAQTEGNEEQRDGLRPTPSAQHVLDILRTTDGVQVVDAWADTVVFEAMARVKKTLERLFEENGLRVRISASRTYQIPDTRVRVKIPKKED